MLEIHIKDKRYKYTKDYELVEIIKEEEVLK